MDRSVARFDGSIQTDAQKISTGDEQYENQISDAFFRLPLPERTSALALVKQRDSGADCNQPTFRCIAIRMWNAASVALLKELWASGHSAAQIANRLAHSRNAVCAKLLRMGLKRGHKPPTANPKIVSVPKRKPVRLAACARPVHKVVSTRKPVVKQPKELTKSQLNEMLAEAAANTARLLR